MGDDDQGFPLYDLGEGSLNQRFIFRIRIGGRLVQNDDLRVFQKGAGDADPLLLASGELPAGVPGNRVVALFQPQDEVVAAALLCGFLHLLIRCVPSAHADIFPYACVEEVIVLGDIGDAAVVILEGDFPDVRPSQEDSALIHVPEGGDQAGDRRFPGAGGADQSIDGPREEGEVDPVQDLLPLLIGEVHISQDDTAVFGLFLGLHRTVHFRSPEDFSHLVKNRPGLCDIVLKGHDGEERGDQAGGEDDHHDEIRRGQKSAEI